MTTNDTKVNTNPALCIALALQGVDDPTWQDRQYAELRVYPPKGAGYFFVRANGADRWYYKDEPGADHFSRADQDEVEAAIRDNARVQLVGSRARSLALWKTWEDFERSQA